MEHPAPEKRTVELLAPAKDTDTGRAAIDHGADAVYIGGADFSARSAAGNSLENIASLAQYAHRYRARIYVALNTLFTDQELPRAETLARELCQGGVDALIVQDTAVLGMNLPPVELHASTQMHVDSPEKADFLYRSGFSRVVLARELSLPQIAAIAARTQAELEAFVHGALCVSYSGQCYLSQCFTGRSANRGRCAQICRLPFDISNPSGEILQRASHALSLKDMNRTEYLSALIEAGVTSLKIEGRLKDAAYVKNVTAWYRRAIDEYLVQGSANTPLTRPSDGIARLGFSPDPLRSFNRGFSHYHLDGKRSEKLSNPATPKSLGQPAGTIISVTRTSIETDSHLTFSPGDGFISIRPDGTTSGFNINRSEGSRLFPFHMPNVCPGDALFRNLDAAFNRTLSGKTSERTISVDFSLEETPEGYQLRSTDESGFSAVAHTLLPHTPADTPQRQRITETLSKLGGTEFETRNIDLRFPGERFIPLSTIASLRRQSIEALRTERLSNVLARRKTDTPRTYPPLPPGTDADYRLNVSNRLAKEFYRRCGIQNPSAAYEERKISGARLALCLHCLRYDLDLCPRKNPGVRGSEYLLLQSGRIRLRAEFDCSSCRMILFEAD